MRRRVIVWTSLPFFLFSVFSHPTEARTWQRSGSVKVMTRNLYLGADVFRILEAQSPEEVPLKVAEILAIVLGSHPAERMEAVANEIAKKKPHLIGLQEAFVIEADFPDEFIPAHPAFTGDVSLDYLSLLLEALNRRGLDYRLASAVQNVDVSLPGLAGLDPTTGQPAFFAARVADRDVILVRGNVETANEVSGNYAFNVPVPIGGTEIEFLRGFTSVDAWVHGRKYRFVSTHLEVGEGPALMFQALQAQELLGILATVEGPTLVVGDFNSSPADPAVDGMVPAYQQFAVANYVDAWAARRGPRTSGYTCCQDETLDNPTSALDQRIDLIWVRNTTAHHHIRAIGPIQTVLVGNRAGDRTASGLWPSDHAGVISRIRISVPH